jgi:two-component system phosphate regulon sensor histidine kinase PhoR|tara:strand:- start:6554 stop:7774 length:1221 start_codon:yes stop_codon:yes gene_type:complete
MNKMKKLFLIISIPTITILMMLNAPNIYIFGLITIFIIAFYVADKNTQSNDIILQSKLDNPKNPTEYSIIKRSTLFTHNEQPMVIVDGSFVIRSSNQAFKNFCGGNPDGQPIAISLRSPDIDSAIESINAKNVFRSVEFSIFQSVEKYLLAQLFTIKHKSKFVLLSITDISDLKAADKLKTSFVSNVSHELRTPLASILGLIETIEGPAKNDEKKKHEFFLTIKSEAERMHRLVNDLLSLSRVEESQFQLPNEKIDLIACVESALDAIGVIADKKKIVISFEKPPNPIYIRGNMDQVIEVFANLLDNAVAYSSDGSKVSLKYETLAEYEKISVCDEGIGIATDDLTRVTERFYRTQQSVKLRKNSSGLGLAIVKHIISRHEGNFEISSALGQGSEFSVSLPKYLDS